MRLRVSWSLYGYTHTCYPTFIGDDPFACMLLYVGIDPFVFIHMCGVGYSYTAVEKEMKQSYS